MTLMNLIRRYRRWNPVHPTYGAFWGFGMGLGCGVGWGPGFGPEAVGFVGAGCGVGFSVGVTLIGVGVGLPSSGLTNLPWNALVWTGNGASNVSSTLVFPALAFTAKQTWEALSFQAASFDRGIHKLCNSPVLRSRTFLLDSRKKFLRKVQDSRNKAATHEDSVLQLHPQDVNQQGYAPRTPQTVSLTPHRRVPPQTSSHIEMATPSRELQSRNLPEDSKGGKN